MCGAIPHDYLFLSRISGFKHYRSVHFAQGCVPFAGLEGEGQEHPESRRYSVGCTVLPTVPHRPIGRC